jgi:hypothetical protein
MAEPSKSRVQHFNVQCPAGHRIRGERTLGYQALRCPGCGEGVFVLPVSPLPEPAAPENRRAKRAATAVAAPIEEGPVGLAEVPFGAEYSSGATSGAADAEIVWDDPDAEPDRPDPPPSRGVAAKPGARRRDDRSPPRGDSPPTDEADGRSAAARHPFEADRRGSRRSRRRPILIFLAVVTLALGTLSYRVWRSRRQELPGIYELGRSEGVAALDAGSFDKAHQLLAAAKRAVDSLGGGLEGAAEVRQAADEAAIFIDLVPETLENLLNEAAPMDPPDWENRFNAFYAGHSILIDAFIVAAPTASEESAYALDYLILPPGDPSQFRENGAYEPARIGRIDLTDFELIQLARPKVGAHVVFGAKLASFNYDPTANIWNLRLQPKSGVFITHAKALEHLGWPTDSVPAEQPPEVQ